MLNTPHGFHKIMYLYSICLGIYLLCVYVLRHGAPSHHISAILTYRNYILFLLLAVYCQGSIYWGRQGGSFPPNSPDSPLKGTFASDIATLPSVVSPDSLCTGCTIKLLYRWVHKANGPVNWTAYLGGMNTCMYYTEDKIVCTRLGKQVKGCTDVWNGCK